MSRCVVVALALLAAGCQQRPLKAVELGQQLFGDPALSDNPANAVSCATCHATTEAPPAQRLLPGHTLYNAAWRGRWWGGNHVRFLDSVSFCLTEFMGASQPLAATDASGKALYEYLVSLSPEEVDPLPLTVITHVQDVPRGDPVRGRWVYDAACATCHGAKQTGEGRTSANTPALAELMASYPRTYPGTTPGLVVAEKVRHGRFFQMGGVMPLFSTQALSDQDLGALLAYLEE